MPLADTSAACFMSGASAKTMLGDLPPSSRKTRFRLERAEYSSSRRPTAPEPVKAMRIDIHMQAERLAGRRSRGR